VKDLIEQTGRLLYGDQWVTAMARDLCVERRTVTYWAAGKRTPRPDKLEGLRAILLQRQSAYPDLIRRLEEAANPIQEQR
jgi:hypothetical protein